MCELETESTQSRAEIAIALGELAADLEGGGPMTIELGGHRVTVDPTEPITFKLEDESD